MEQTVWVDLLFFVNFCMDFQCLFLTAKLLRRPFSVWRAVIAAAMGALYACAALFLVTSGVVALFLDLLACFLMCVITFLQKGKWRLFIPFAVYFGVSCAVGGVMSGVASLVSRLDLRIETTGSGTSSAVFLVLAAVGGALTFLWARFCERRAKGTRATLTLELLGKRVTVMALVDTANLLCDPVGGRSVVILERRVASSWLPLVFPERETPPDGVLATLPSRLARRTRLLPTATVTGEGLLLAIAPDRALLDTGRGAREVELLVGAASLASFPTDCEALLPAALITE